MSASQMVSVECPPCFVCGIRSIVDVPLQGHQLRMSGALVQTAFPEMDYREREMLISGIHPECWLSEFGDDDDQEL